MSSTMVKDNLKIVEEPTVNALTEREKNVLAGQTMIHADKFEIKSEAMRRLTLIQETSYALERKINSIGTIGMTLALIEDYEALKNLLRKIEVAEGSIALDH